MDIKNRIISRLEELSKKTLSNYIKDAHRDEGSLKFEKGFKTGVGATTKQQREFLRRKIKNRRKGIDKAVDKLTKESVEQVDELSKKTLGNYIKSASSDKSHLAHEIGKINHKAQTSGTTAVDREDRDELNRKHGKRSGGIEHAVNKLTKEDVDLEEGYKVGDMVNVTNPKATPRYKILGKTKTHYHLEKPNGDTMHLPKARIAKVNKARFDMKKANESVEQVDEISAKVADNYINKSVDDIHNLSQRSAMTMNKSKKEKLDKKIGNRNHGIRQAINRLYKEEIEQVDEAMKLNKDNTVLHSGSSEAFAKEYVKGHKGDYSNSPTEKHKKDSDKFYSKYEYKHGKSGFGGSGEGTYINKTTGEKYHVKRTPAGGSFYATNHHIMKESVEQVDEISKGTLSSYVKKSIADKENRTSAVHNSGGITTNLNGMNVINGSEKAAEYVARKQKNRSNGINKALDKLTKEDVELDESVNKAIYNNTPENRKKLKLDQKLDKVQGDNTAKYFTHHIDKGVFKFHNKLPEGEKVRS